ncbi:restriction endonuclease subunit S [Rhizobium laguerreae]|uniref:restriction endonuclease subunit S n=1 Tax=Rhizobium laguerreae TaxID=1076926 RepID=UPI001440FD9A|nr:restriction endonuclease subunit S [Rhizobium laguerreae]
MDDYISFISYGFTNPMPTTSSGPLMVTAADIFDGKVAVETARRTSQEAYDRLLTAKSKPRRNDILLTKDGALGRIGLVGEETICINQSVAILRANNRIQPQFLALLLQADLYQKRMIEDAGGSTIKHIYITIVNRMPIAVPESKIEQRAIAAALSDVDAALEGLERLIAKKRDLKQAAMQQLLTGKIRLPGFSGEWELKRLAEIGDIRSGGTPSTSQAHLWDGEIPWCTPTDITALDGRKYLSETARTISAAGLRSSSAETIPPQSLIMTSRATIGECAINSVAITTNQGFKNIVPFDGYDVEFLYYLMTTKKDDLIALCGGSTFLEIGKKQLTSFILAVPKERDEQSAVAAVLSDMDTELAAVRAQRDKTRLLKQAMMQELLTGRIRLPIPEEIPEVKYG